MNYSHYFLLLISSPFFLLADEHYFVDTIGQYISLSATVKNTLYKMASSSTQKNKISMQNVSRPLYKAYPKLKKSVAHCMLADLPTPISRLATLESHFSHRCALFIKDDGVTGLMKPQGRLFGGNKMRKLEFLCADALMQGATSLMTFGCIGSNHVVATAVAAQYLSLRCISMLTPQEVTPVVKRNLLLMHENGAGMVLNPTRELRDMQTICSVIQSKYNHDNIPYFIPTGGSSPIGIIGFVNAAFELKEQIKAGHMPSPDYLYVAMGSCGTLVGLTLGLRVAGLKTKVIGVAVEPDDVSHTFLKRILTLLEGTNRLLHEKDNSFPFYEWNEESVHLLYGFGGPKYGAVTSEALAAIECMQKREHIRLDTTYTGKACAGMFDEIKNGKRDGTVILFWNTFCANVPDPLVRPGELSPAFQQFFTEDVR